MNTSQGVSHACDQLAVWRQISMICAWWEVVRDAECLGMLVLPVVTLSIYGLDRTLFMQVTG